jgi:hypothetical protein
MSKSAQVWIYCSHLSAFKLTLMRNSVNLERHCEWHETRYVHRIWIQSFGSHPTVGFHIKWLWVKAEWTYNMRYEICKKTFNDQPIRRDYKIGHQLIQRFQFRLYVRSPQWQPASQSPSSFNPPKSITVRYAASSSDSIGLGEKSIFRRNGIG